MRRTALALTLMMGLLLLLMAIGTFFKSTKANPLPPPGSISQIYIRSDGSVEPSNASMQRIGNTYTFMSDLSNSSFLVECDNIVIDAANFTISGYGDQWYEGFILSNRTNVTIQNAYISSFGLGISITESSNISVLGNTIHNAFRCIELTSVNNSQIVGNNMTSGSYGVYSYNSHHNIIVGNYFADFNVGLRMEDSNYDIILQNQFNASKNGILLDGAQNIIYRNNFLNNTENAGTSVVVGVNFWNYSQEGNYWSNFNGSDANDDGIGDYPQIISLTQFDYCPLMKPTNISTTLPTPLPTPPPPQDPVIPEFPTLLIYVPFVVVTLLARAISLVFLRKRKH